MIQVWVVSLVLFGSIRALTVPRCRAAARCHERQDGTGNGDGEWRHGHLYDLDAQSGHNDGQGGVRW